MLEKHERERALRFHADRDRNRYVLTRAFVREVLSQYVPIAPDQWRFGASAYGRPVILNELGAAASIRFNLTHTDGLILLAIGCDCQLGVDAECTLREVPAGLAATVLTGAEQATLSALAEGPRQRRFFDLWTLKESYMKARGLGLSIPPATLHFGLDPDGAIRFSPAGEQGANGAGWRFLQWSPGAHHRAALCVDTSVMPRVRVRRMDPAGSTQLLPFCPDRVA